MDGRKRKREPWIVSSLKSRGMRLYKATLINSHSFEKQQFLFPAVTDQEACLKILKRLSRLKKVTCNGSFWFAEKSTLI